MASTEASRWLQTSEGIIEDLERAVGEARDIRRPDQAKKLEWQGIVDDVKEQAAKLERELANFERTPHKYKIGGDDLTRRKGTMADIKGLLRSLEDAAGGGNGGNGRAGRGRPARGGAADAADRDALMDRSGGGGGGRRVVEDDENTRDLSNKQLFQVHVDQRERQEKALDDIYVGVGRLKEMGKDINTELDLHANLLDDLDGAVTATDARIVANTKGVEFIEEKQGGCCPLCTMLILFALIIFLLSTNLPCKFLPSAKC